MTGRQHAVAADCVFDGAAVYRHHAVVIEGETIAAVVPRGDVPTTVAVHALPDGAWLAPGFIDVQVNGGGDVLFNDDPSPETIAAITAAHRRFGTTSLLPTLITDSLDKMRAAQAAVEAATGQIPAFSAFISRAHGSRPTSRASTIRPTFARRSGRKSNWCRRRAAAWRW
jgi:N-acetylglucosamine-6-phosphate deacetylase